MIELFDMLLFKCECGACREFIPSEYSKEFHALVKKYSDNLFAFSMLKGHELLAPNDWEAKVEETEHFVVMELKSDTVSE